MYCASFQAEGVCVVAECDVRCAKSGVRSTKLTGMHMERSEVVTTVPKHRQTGKSGIPFSYIPSPGSRWPTGASALRFGSLIVVLGRRVSSPAPTVIYIIAGEMDSPGLERQT